MINLVTAFTGGLSAIDFALKYENLKYIHLMACEIDKYARKQFLEFHQSPLSFPEDVSLACGKHLKGKVDLYCFGSPCQDLSLAGKRKGFLGEKSSLFRHGARVLEEMMPKVFIFENVKGLLSSNKGADYAEVIKTFQDMGYLIQMKVLNAKEHGTAQNRERVFIVGFLDEDAYHAFNFEEPIPLTKVLRDYIDDEVEEKYYLSEKMIKGFISHKEVHAERGNGFAFTPKEDDDIANCLSTKNGSRATDNFVKEPTLKQVGMLDIKGADSTKRVYSADGICPTMTTMGGGNRQPKLLPTSFEVGVVESMVATNIKDSVRKNFVRDYEEIIKSDKPIFYSDCESGFQDNKVCLTESACLRANNSDLFTLDRQFRIRRLIPRECGRLMGMRDEDINIVLSDSQAYKIFGNGIEINTIRSIVRGLYKPKAKLDTLF
jgi:DNA (cytosine-5)-methyltransferase 1